MSKKRKDPAVSEVVNEERNNLVERYAKENGQEDIPKEEPKTEIEEAEPKEENPTTEVPPKEEPKKTTESPEEKKVTEPTTDKVVTDELEKPQKPDTPEDKEIQMVPHAALHEEREKHKVSKSKISELQGQVNVLNERLDKMAEGEIEPSEVPNKEIVALKAQVAALQKSQEVFNEAAQKQTVEAEKARIAKLIDTTDKELSDSGMPGFKQFGALVGQEIGKLVEQDEANKHLDYPEGWKKIYKEKVYPTIARLQKQTGIDEHLKKKEAEKEDVNLVPKGGTPPASKKEKSDDDFTMTDALSMRNNIT